MPRRYLNRWTTWLLPLIVLRAFLPAGFMLSADDGRLALIWCTGVVAPAPSALHAEHGAEQHAHAALHGDHHHDPAGSTESEGYPPCPFALTATACIFDLPYFATAFDLASFDEVAFESAFVSHSFLRGDRIRGPPHLA